MLLLLILLKFFWLWKLELLLKLLFIFFGDIGVVFVNNLLNLFFLIKFELIENNFFGCGFVYLLFIIWLILLEF